MKITKTAIAGTLESSDVQVTVTPNGADGIDLELDSSVMNRFGNQIRAVILQTLSNLDVTSGKVTVLDKGALDCTIKARVECAVFRAHGQTDEIPWRGAVR